MTLAGRILLAKPELSDPNFDGTVTLMLAHDEDGAMGLVLNRPSGRAVEALETVWGVAMTPPVGLFSGGPVGTEGVVALGRHPDSAGPLPFGLRSVDPSGPEAEDEPVEQVRLFLGHAGWGPGQLEDELGQGAWWTTAGSADLVFDPDPSSLWRRLVRGLGGDVALWSTWTSDPSTN